MLYPADTLSSEWFAETQLKAGTNVKLLHVEWEQQEHGVCLVVLEQAYCSLT
jgi:hypothetical protein